MKVFCLGGLLCLALNASALSFTYSGTVSSSTAHRVGETDPFINAGDAFTVTLTTNPNYTSPNHHPEYPAVSFTLTIGGYFFQTYPFEFSGSYVGTDADFSASSTQEIWGSYLFRGGGQVNLTETGGTIFLGLTRSAIGLEPMGSISVAFGDAAQPAPSSQPVPEAASTLGLLALGFAAVVGSRFHGLFKSQQV